MRRSSSPHSSSESGVQSSSEYRTKHRQSSSGLSRQKHGVSSPNTGAAQIDESGGSGSHSTVAASSKDSRFAKASTRVFSPLLSKTRTPALYEAEPPKVVKAEKPATVLSWGLAQTRARWPSVVTASKPEIDVSRGLRSISTLS